MITEEEFVEIMALLVNTDEKRRIFEDCFGRENAC